MKKIPVILDTNLGTDIDDSWAIAYMLKCPELDVKLITTATGDTTYRAKLCARLLRAGGRTDVPIGIGIPLGAVKERLYDYANELDFPSAVSQGRTARTTLARSYRTACRL